jgi:hypothetical protein
VTQASQTSGEISLKELQGFYDENRELFIPEAQIRAEFDALLQLNSWSPAKIKPQDWLENFEVAEMPYALQMLHKFVFFSDDMTDHLLASAFHQISSQVARGKSFKTAEKDWDSFCNSAIITYVTGETPNPTDSGHLFARKGRQFLGLSEDSFCSPDEAVRNLNTRGYGHVVLVDDFVGSGNQFIETWQRPISVGRGNVASFKSLTAQQRISTAFYCNAVTTSAGAVAIAQNCPGVNVLAGNVLGPEFSFVSGHTRRWPAAAREIGERFVFSLRARYDFLAEDESEEDWRGFHALGLGLAFEHSTPDATLPIFHSERNGWQPLVRLA